MVIHSFYAKIYRCSIECLLVQFISYFRPCDYWKMRLRRLDIWHGFRAMLQGEFKLGTTFKFPTLFISYTNIVWFTASKTIYSILICSSQERFDINILFFTYKDKCWSYKKLVWFKGRMSTGRRRPGFN